MQKKEEIRAKIAKNKKTIARAKKRIEFLEIELESLENSPKVSKSGEKPPIAKPKPKGPFVPKTEEKEQEEPKVSDWAEEYL